MILININFVILIHLNTLYTYSINLRREIKKMKILKNKLEEFKVHSLLNVFFIHPKDFISVDLQEFSTYNFYIYIN